MSAVLVLDNYGNWVYCSSSVGIVAFLLIMLEAGWVLYCNLRHVPYLKFE